MKRLILVLFLCAVSLFSCTSPFSKQVEIDAVKETIMQGENAEIPLYVQEFENVFRIQIDSIVFTTNVSPYSGYLITSWDLNEKQNLSVHQWAANGYKDKYVRKTKTAYVPITNIVVDTKKDIVQWNSNWSFAYYNIKDEE